jgi:ABC-type Fe3+-siderophore transport system permease subunit
VSFEIPVGIFTSILGIPIFVYLLSRAKKVWL